MQDLVAGQIDWAIPVPDTSLPQMRAGRIKIYAVAAPGRLPAAPDIPTVDEAGRAVLASRDSDPVPCRDICSSECGERMN
jgi:tripartite-type tricarboxylate transporter receptor subunit TctC